MIRKTILFLATLNISTNILIAQSFIVAADSSSGTYKKMLGELIGVCSSENLDIRPAADVTGGAPGNLEALVNNKAQAAFLHSDVYFANAQADPSYKRFQTLVALYPEPIHVLVLRDSKVKAPGWNPFTPKPVFNSLSDAKGFVVGAAGGGVYTARILEGQGEGGFKVKSYDTGDEVLAGLNNGEIAAAIFVGAAPLPNIEHLNGGQYKLIPIGESIANRVNGVYRPVTINYRGLTNGPIRTMAPMATLLTRKYTTSALVDVQRKFRNCFYEHLGELQDTGSPNWQAVNVNDHGVLDWYEIPGTKPEATKTSRKKLATN